MKGYKVPRFYIRYIICVSWIIGPAIEDVVLNCERKKRVLASAVVDQSIDATSKIECLLLAAATATDK
jgi:hypothetical protein